MAIGSKISSEASQGLSSLRRESLLLLLKHASRDVMKRKATPKHDRKLQELYEELLSLRSAVPSFNQESAISCVISDALEYIDQLKEQLEQLKSTNSHVGTAVVDAEVEVVAKEDEKVLIDVCCQKRPNLLSTLMEYIEDLEITYQEINVSCADKLAIHAVGSLQKPLQLDEVERGLIHTIESFGNPEKAS